MWPENGAYPGPALDVGKGLALLVGVSVDDRDDPKTMLRASDVDVGEGTGRDFSGRSPSLHPRQPKATRNDVGC